MRYVIEQSLYESFNNAFIKARDKPILSLLKHIRVYLMRRLNAKRQYMKGWFRKIYPNAFTLLDKNKCDAS